MSGVEDSDVVAGEKSDVIALFRLNRPEAHDASNLALKMEFLGAPEKTEREGIDRGTLSIAKPLIRKELGLSLGDMGPLLSGVRWAYAFSRLPIGGLG